MNDIQNQLLDFVLERVAGDNHENVRSLISTEFEKHNNGSADISSLTSLLPQLAGFLKPEKQGEVEGLLSNIGTHPDSLSGLFSTLTGLVGGGESGQGGGSAVDQIKGLLSMFAK